MDKDEISPVLVFDDSSKKEIIMALGLIEDKESRLVDEKGLIQTNQDFQVVHSNELGGVLKGSKIIIKKDVADLVTYFRKK